MKQIRKTIGTAAAVLCMLLALTPTDVSAAYAQETAESTAADSAATGSGQSGEENTKKKNQEFSNEQFHIRALPGLSGYVKTGIPVPLTIYVESLQEDFEGVLRVIVPGEQYFKDAVAYEKDLMLTAGNEKTVSISVENIYTTSPLKLELEDTKGNIVLTYDITLQGQSAENALVGILSDDFTALNYMDGNTINVGNYSGSTQVVELTTEQFPDQSSGLEALSYLVINSYNSSALNEDQQSALKSWVKSGGILILGTGPDYQQTLSGFQDDFVSGSIGAGQNGELRLVEEPDAEAESDAVAFTDADGIVTLSVNDGAPLEGILSTPELIWTQTFWQGQVVLTAFNLGMEPVTSWSAKNEMAKALFEKAASGYSIQRIEKINYGSYLDSWSLSNALNVFHNVTKPNMFLLIILFIVFVILAGPGLYLILKAVDKRGFMWVIIPALSIVVTGCVFLFSSDMRIKKPQTASLTGFYYDNEENARSQNVYLGIQVPSASKSEITLDAALSNLSVVPGNGYSFSPFGNTGTEDIYAYKAAVRELPEGYQVGIQNGTTFGSVYMTADGSSQTNLPENNGLDTSLVNTVSGIKGSVTNNTGYDLLGVSVYTHNRMVMIGSLKAGESAEFDIKDNESFQFNYDSLNFASYQFPEIGNEEQKLMQLNNVWNLFGEMYLYTIDDQSAYTFALLPQWENGYVTADDATENSAAMFIRRDIADYEDYPGASSISLYNYTMGNPDNWDGDGWFYDIEVEASFDVHEKFSQVYALIKSDEDTSQWGIRGNVTIYGYNQQTNEYDKLFTDGSVMEFKEGCPYLNEDGILQMKFVSDNQEQDNYVPQITAIGGGN